MENTPKTFNELVAAILKVVPNASFGEDNDGQIVIYTDLTDIGGPEGTLVPFESE